MSELEVVKHTQRVGRGYKKQRVRASPIHFERYSNLYFHETLFEGGGGKEGTLPPVPPALKYIKC